MTDEDLIAAARKALEGTTPGPWHTALLDSDLHDIPRHRAVIKARKYFGRCVAQTSGPTIALMPWCDADHDADALFVAAARDLVPMLANRLYEVAKERDAIEKAFMDECEAYSAQHDTCFNSIDRAEAAEAKLAKAVEALQKIAKTYPADADRLIHSGREILFIARAALAEIGSEPQP